MARIARAVAPGYPHHITQRGNYKQDIFEEEKDFLKYDDLVKSRHSHENGNPVTM